jgi:cytochrome c oxidase subunit 2
VTRTSRRLSTLVLIATALLGACASSHGVSTGSTPAAQGKTIAMKQGCTNCHGATAQGGLGPSWIGLSGSTVQLDDGTQVTADDAYIAESIRTPSAKRVAGYSIAMPPTHLSDDEVAALVAYIDSLAARTGG